MPRMKHDEIADRLLSFGRPVMMIEVGVWTGANVKMLLALVPSLSVLMVDSWSPPEEGSSYRASKDVKAFMSKDEFEAARDMSLRIVDENPGRCSMLQMKSVEAAKIISDASVDLVFIDADHSYEAVLSDVRAWWPKVAEGGFIGGHDWNYPHSGFRVAEAVLDHVGEIGLTPEAVETGEDWTWFVRIGDRQ